MIRKVVASFLLLAIGAFMLLSGARHWREDPVRRYAPMDAEVLDHQVMLNRERWKSDEPHAMEVATRVRLMEEGHENGQPVVVRKQVAYGEEAWDLAHSEPPGTRLSLLLSPDLQSGLRVSLVPSGPMVAMIVGCVVMLIAFAIHLPIWEGELASTTLLTVICMAFLAIGITSASSMWPEVISQIRAAKWDLTACQFIGQRNVGTGKGTRREAAIRYTAAGKTYESVLRNPSYGIESRVVDASHCRVNPARPWQATLHWGWRPGLAVALFPVPFLTIGLLGFVIPFSSVLQSRFEGTSTASTSQQPFGPWAHAVGAGLALLFTGSIVGVFVGLCGEMWLVHDGMRWFLTPFLIPFVWVVLKLGKAFFTNFGKALFAQGTA